MLFGFSYLFVFIFGVLKNFRSSTILILISLVLISITFFLGIWQLKRLHWKNSLIVNFNELKTSNAIDLSLALEKEFIKIKSKGIINRKNKIFFPAKTNSGKTGIRLASEFISENGNIYLIDEGWFENSDFEYFKTNNDTFNENIIGYIRFPRDKKFFTPNNNITNNEWYTYNLKEIGEFFSSPLNQILFIKKLNINKEHFLIPSTPTHQFRNNHLQYSITWFCMSLAFLIMILVYLKKNKNE
jgi:surfeit locus 1 family protein